MSKNPIIYDGNEIGGNLEFGHYVLIRQNNKIGNNVRIGSFVEIAHHVLIEDDVKIHSKVFIPEFTIIRKGCWIGPGTKFVNDPYPQSGGKYRKAPIIEREAIIGANVTIMSGVTIGSKAIIGAGSVVTKNVPAGQVWSGNPAEYKKNREYLEAYKTK